MKTFFLCLIAFCFGILIGINKDFPPKIKNPILNKEWQLFDKDAEDTTMACLKVGSMWQSSFNPNMVIVVKGVSGDRVQHSFWNSEWGTAKDISTDGLKFILENFKPITRNAIEYKHKTLIGSMK